MEICLYGIGSKISSRKKHLTKTTPLSDEIFTYHKSYWFLTGKGYKIVNKTKQKN